MRRDDRPAEQATEPLDLDRLEAILEHQVEEVAYEATLRSMTDVLPDALARFLAPAGATDVVPR